MTTPRHNPFRPLNEIARAAGVVVLTLTSKSKRPQNGCSACGYTWYPRGKDLSISCPNCSSRDVYLWPGAGGCGWICIGILVLLLMTSYGPCGDPDSSTSASTAARFSMYLAATGSGFELLRLPGAEWRYPLPAAGFYPYMKLRQGRPSVAGAADGGYMLWIKREAPNPSLERARDARRSA